MTVRCKFIVDSVTKTRHGSAIIKMSPVSAGSEENKKFWNYTPSGSFEISTVNDIAVEQFEIGKEYYFDISKAVE